MELPGAALAVLLLTAALSAHSCSASRDWLPFPLNKDLAWSVPSLTVGSITPTDCCFSFVSRQIPRKLVDDYYETSSQCSQPGVIFKTKRGRQVCADPSEDWVQEYITDLELNP
nr:C-C motif chemokine 3-like [Odocoileus virginianus texanus]